MSGGVTGGGQSVRTGYESILRLHQLYVILAYIALRDRT